MADLAKLVSIVRRADGTAGFTGLQICGSVWHCPVCSARISEVRRDELNKALAWSRVQSRLPGTNIVPVMMTLTARHTRRDDLREQLDAMKEAKRRLRQSHTWRCQKQWRVGTITATELTHGANGWHSHFHELLFLDIGDGVEADAVKLVKKLRAEWIRSLGKVGLTGGQAAFDAQGGQSASQYIAKWGLGEELTLHEHKRGAGRSPFQILGDAKDGDKRSAALFVEYARVFHGRRQLVWSNGFKDMVGINDLDDDEVVEGAEASEELEEVIDEIIAQIPRDVWRRMTRRNIDRAALLRAAETGGFDAVADVIAECLGASSVMLGPADASA